jgi:hypothetical protein
MRALTTILVLSVVGVAEVQAQRATEQFIPVGQSPGVSGVYSYLGECEAVDEQGQTVTMREAQGQRRTVTVGPATRIWLDRSAAKESNQQGSFHDLLRGHRMEVLVAPERPDTAVWIKVVVAGGGAE